jgi:hypothetical protein
MKILERYDQTKTVEAWGETWTVPVEVNYASYDEFGEVMFFTYEPHRTVNTWAQEEWGEFFTAANIEPLEDWRDSLVYVGDQHENAGED